MAFLTTRIAPGMGLYRRTTLRILCRLGLPRGRRELLVRSLLVSFSVGLALLVMEATLRLFLPAQPSVEIHTTSANGPRTSETRATDVVTGFPSSPALFEVTETGLRMRPNADVTIHHHVTGGGDISVRTNQYGFRGADLAAKVVPRILFLGDSIVWADYLNEPETFVYQVGELAKRAGRNYEVINAGTPLASLSDELSILLERGLAAQPDFVVLGFYLNDFNTSAGTYLQTPHPRGLRLAALLREALSRFSEEPAIPAPPVAEPDEQAARLLRWRHNARDRHPPSPGDWHTDRGAFNAQILDYFEDWGSGFSEDAWDEVLEPLLSELARQATLHHFRLFFVCLPVRMQVESDVVWSDYPQRRLASTGRALGIPVLDLLPPLREAHAHDGAELYYDQCHNTPQGSAVIAREIWRFLQAQGL